MRTCTSHCSHRGGWKVQRVTEHGREGDETGWTSIHLSVKREGILSWLFKIVKLRPVTKFQTKHIIKKAFSRELLTAYLVLK